MAELFKMKLLDVNKNQILPETSADQVTMAGGGNVEDKIKSLENAFASGINLRGTVGSGGTVETRRQLQAGRHVCGSDRRHLRQSGL